jgi:hypothetical protein
VSDEVRECFASVVFLDVAIITALKQKVDEHRMEINIKSGEKFAALSPASVAVPTATDNDPPNLTLP